MISFSTGNPIVDRVGMFNLEGNIIPHTWYHQLRFKDGKPDFISMFLLAEIVYWYRPTYVRDEQTGQILAVKKKFHADALQKSYADLEKLFGFSEKQIRQSFERLEEKGIVKRDPRTIIKSDGRKANNVLYIQLFPDVLEKLTYPHLTEATNEPTGQEPGSLQGSRVVTSREGGWLPPGKEPTAPQGRTNTKITTENTSEITTKRYIGEFVRLKEEEYVKLIEKFGQQDADERIAALDDYIGSTGTTKYKDHYRTILSWWRREQKESRGKQNAKTRNAEELARKNNLPF